MTSDSSSTSLRGWALGIIGAVLTAVLIFAIEQKLQSPQKQPPPQSESIVSINGQIFDLAQKRLLENVDVQVHVSSLNEEQKTDSLGRYAFSLVGFDPQLSGSMHIEAPGYKTLTYNLSLQKMSNLQDLYLEALGQGSPPGAGGIVMSHPNLANRYVPRIDVRSISAPIQKIR